MLVIDGHQSSMRDISSAQSWRLQLQVLLSQLFLMLRLELLHAQLQVLAAANFA